MRNALPILLIAMVGAIWLARSADEGSTLVAALHRRRAGAEHPVDAATR